MEHPLTQLLLNTLSTNITGREEQRKYLTENKDLNRKTVQNIKELNGHIFALEQVYDIKEFLKDEIERLDNDEVDNLGTQSPSEDGDS